LAKEKNLKNKRSGKSITERKESADNEFKEAKDSKERIKILVKRLKKLHSVQASNGSRNCIKRIR